ncbi:piggyBac transposable element-derived protein 4-like [Poecilia reticulata]|uniref:PiggyBac transposable element-derived protein 4-like n=1 Tax=Poecilia reticulata TaxID=8081 RepID=A0A3P9Q8N7_POERE|nr:PREDICTED: piggyBac transposable element-derived protein 4-like [Poecilia reticulata]
MSCSGVTAEQAGKHFNEFEEEEYGAPVEETDSDSDSEFDFDDSDYEVEDPSIFFDEEEEKEEEEEVMVTRSRSVRMTSTPQKTPRRTPHKSPQRTPQRARARSRSPLCEAAAETRHGRWNTEKDADTAPVLSRFQPKRTPGIQLDVLAPYSPKELFLLFFSADTVKTICDNTNRYAAKNQARGKKYKWVKVDTDELYKFLGLLIYMSLVQLPCVQDYWKQNHFLSVLTPAKVMARDRFRTIMWNIHLSNPEEDVKNDEKKGTPGYDKLFRLRPVYDEILRACQAYYHPKREIAVDERMVATKAKTSMTQYMKNKPNKWGLKLFVLAESISGYTLSFSLYTGKTSSPSEHGLSYDVVMSLIQPSYLGTGYHIYMDNYYTSPTLLTDLARAKFGACGTYRESRKGCPRERPNALTKKSERGSVRWIREGPLVFVKWMDTREVSVCSTIHPAFSGEMVQRRVKDEEKRWTVKEIPCPTPIMAYNKYMGGVDLSDQLIQYYSAQRKTHTWYKNVFMHLIDIASTNAYILHRDLSATKGVQPMSHKDFNVMIASQLCGVDMAGMPKSRATDHTPVPIHAEQKAHKARRQCRHCLQVDKLRKDTSWKCKRCDVPLCLLLDRNCFEKWHS